MSTPRSTGFLAAACLGLAACTSSGASSAPPSSDSSMSSGGSPTSADSSPGPSGESSSSGQATRDATTTPTQTGPDEITLAFGGDVHFEQHLQPLARDPDSLSSLRPTLGAADVSMVNLETAITDGGTPVPKAYNFRAPASALETIAGAGVDVVTMANNHGVDYGPEGLEDTLAAERSSPIPIVGIGKDAEEAYAPAEFTRGGVSIAIFGASQLREETLAQYSADEDSGGVASAHPRDRLVEDVRRAAKQHDLVVVYPHWGLGKAQCPDPRSVQTAKALEEAGADIVVGSHSHRVNGAGWLGDAYVGYGLGNFVWYQSDEPDSRSGVLTLTVDADAARADKPTSNPLVTDAEWTPMLIGTDGVPRRPGPADSQRLLDLWNQARECTGLDASP